MAQATLRGPDITAPDPFFSPKNQVRLLKAARQMEQSGGTVHSLAEEKATRQQS